MILMPKKIIALVSNDCEILATFSIPLCKADGVEEGKWAFWAFLARIECIPARSFVFRHLAFLMPLVWRDWQPSRKAKMKKEEKRLLSTDDMRALAPGSVPPRRQFYPFMLSDQAWDARWDVA